MRGRNGKRSRMPAGRAFRFLFLVLAATASLQPPAAQEGAYSEHAVKAAFLYHFGTYVEWPADAGRLENGVSIAVYGDDDVYLHLDRYLPGRTIGEHAVLTRELDSIADLDADEILFIGRAARGELDALLADMPQPGLLVVTESPSGLMPGAVINFRIVDDRVRFEVSLAAAAEAGLMLSSRLLAAALAVEPAPDTADGGSGDAAQAQAGIDLASLDQSYRSTTNERQARQQP